MRKTAVLLLFLAAGCKEKPKGLAGTFAVLETSMGTVTVRLLKDQRPRTCAHFIALAKGTKAWRDPKTGAMKKAPIYDGLLFHRVIAGFMVQTGDPLGTGDGDIGVTILDELTPELRFDRPGLLGMANHGPNTNGSQFFLTVAPAPMLDGHHTLFGEVVEGLDVVKAISKVKRDEREVSDRPLKPVYLKKVTVFER
ncbi:MAG: peptidylprolyl isomerase [Elusimicrobiota bacterium]